jgi:hypothetical protein
MTLAAACRNCGSLPQIAADYRRTCGRLPQIGQTAAFAATCRKSCGSLPQALSSLLISMKRHWRCCCFLGLLRRLRVLLRLLGVLGARSRSFIFSPYVSSAPLPGDEPTNTIARSGHGAPAGRGRGTLSEDKASTRVALLAVREASWSGASLRRCRA